MINRQNHDWRLAPAPLIEWRDSAPISTTHDDVYFNTDDGVAESRYVFLEGIRFIERIRALSPNRRYSVAELGYGTGLNFLVTLDAWLRHRPEGARLHYVGIEAYPLRASELEVALTAAPELTALANDLLSRWPEPTMGCHRLQWQDQGVTLDLWWETAEAALVDLASHGDRWIDSWYLDGFTPARNPTMWTPVIFEAMSRLSRPKATVATFTAASDVRRGLEEAGFAVKKRPGFGRKRECLWGDFQSNGTPRTSESLKATFKPVTPWDKGAASEPNPQRMLANSPSGGHSQGRRDGMTAIVIGAGLAGCCVARSLAERGIKVTVLERGRIASGGSSNLQGLTYTRLSPKFAPLSDFALASYGFSTRVYAQLLDRALVQHIDGDHCGFIQLYENEKDLVTFSQMLTGDDAPATVVTSEEASELLGLKVTTGGLYFPAAFWLSPPAVCSERLAHPLIHVHENCGEVTIDQVASNWRARTETGRETGREIAADVAILATAQALGTHPGLEWLPLQGIRGQTTHLKATAQTNRLATALCHEGYFPPARQGWHCLGASYGPNDLRLDERSQDHEHNLGQLQHALPELTLAASESPSGHVAIRCTTADYLPIIGPAPNRAAFNATYADLSKQKTRYIPSEPPLLPGLWLLAGLGSRGLTAAPFAAEMIASAIMGEPPPVARYLQKAVSPARFLTRGLIRGKPL